MQTGRRLSIDLASRQGPKQSGPKDYTEENEYLKGRLDEQLKTIAGLREKEVDQHQVSMNKDEYKKKNIELFEENTRLQSENAALVEQTNKMFAADIESKTNYILELEKRSNQLIAGYDEMQQKFSEIETSVSRKDFTFKAELAKENEKLNEIQVKLDRVTEQLQQMRSRRAKRNSTVNHINEFIKERSEVLEFIMDRGMDIQERQKKNVALHKEAERLQLIFDKLQEEVTKMKDQS